MMVRVASAVSRAAEALDADFYSGGSTAALRLIW
jgi:hypothetical protein